MGCFSSRHIDPGMISSPIPIPSSQSQTTYDQQRHLYPPSSSSMSRSRFSSSQPNSGLGSYTFPTQSFAPRDLPQGHPFSNPYSRYMPSNTVYH